MTLREHAWEFVLTALSWLVAVGALLVVAAYLVFDALMTRRKRRR